MQFHSHGQGLTPCDGVCLLDCPLCWVTCKPRLWTSSAVCLGTVPLLLCKNNHTSSCWGRSPNTSPMFINSSIANLHEQSYHILLRKKGIYLSHFIIVDLHHRYYTSTQKLKSYLVRTQSLNVLPLNLGIGQYIAIHAALTARDFFLAYFYPSGPFTCIFSKALLIFSCAGCG